MRLNNDFPLARRYLARLTLFALHQMNAEDTLRQWIIDHSLEIRHDVNLMADMIRQLVTLEREKAGLDNPRGKIELWPNKDKKDATDPDLCGNGRVAGRSYRAAAWISKTDRYKIVLKPPKRK